MLRLSIPSLSLIAVPLFVAGCSRPASWEAVSAGVVPLSRSQEQTIDRILEESAIPPVSVRLLTARDRPGDSDRSGTFARIADGNLTHLALDGVKTSPRLDHLPRLQWLHLSGEFEAVQLSNLPALEFLELEGDESRWQRLTLDALPSLQEAYLFSGRLEGLDLRRSPKLQSVTISNLGLTAVPWLPASIASLTLDHNQIHDLSPLAGLQELAWLDLSANDLDRLSSLPPLPKLRFLRLRGNPLAPNLDTLDPAILPSLRTLDLRQTGVVEAPPALRSREDLEIQRDLHLETKTSFLAYLDRLRSVRASAPGELVLGPDSNHGRLLGSQGNCRWRTATYKRARLDCSFRWDRLNGLAAARLGKTDPAMPYQGGGAPTVQATLRVQRGRAWLYLPRDFDNIALAVQVEDFDPTEAEAFRRPEDQFRGFRRILATPESPAIGQGQPSLIGDRVLLWLEAEGGDAHGLALEIEPTS